MTSADQLDQLVPVSPLSDWLDVHAPNLGAGPLQRRVLGGGATSLLVALDRGGPVAAVLRRPHPHARDSGAAILREANILAALNETDVPHPRCLATCETGDIIGQPFLLMEVVNGWVPAMRDGRLHVPPPFDAPFHRNALRTTMIDSLIAMASVRPTVSSTLGAKAVSAMIEPWVRMLHGALQDWDCNADSAGFRVAAWLRAHLPVSPATGLVHGDYSLTNLMFAHDPPVRLAAILDWETAHVGDPLSDLGWVAAAYADARLGEAAGDGKPSLQEVIHRYCARTARPESEVDFYLVLAGFKSGCILLQQAGRVRAANMGEAASHALSRLAEAAFARALRLAEIVS